MESIFNKDNQPEPPGRYAKVWIEGEIKHLKKPKPVRNLTNVSYNAGRISLLIGFLALIFLYIMDPIFYSFYKDDAIQAYLYLHNYGSDSLANELVQSGILTDQDAAKLDRNTGDFHSYFQNTEAARKEAYVILYFMSQVHALHVGDYDRLDPLQKLRYFLFIKTGLTPPTSWPAINPAVPEP